MFLLILLNTGLYFFYCKDTNLILKYLVFIKTLQIKKTKKCFCFHAYGQVSKKNHIVFSYKENLKKKVLACILALITSLLKS
jgi:hypothetical protein